MTTFTDLRARLSRRALYRKTLAELRRLPLEIKRDLDITGNEERMAHQAVYG